MNDMDYKPNSHRSKEEQKAQPREKRAEQVVTGIVRPKKKNDIQKFADLFIAEDVSNVKSYIFMDVLVPAIKKAVSDIVRDGIDMILYGESGRSSKRSDVSKISYSKYYDRKDDDRFVSSSRASSRYSYDEIIFRTRGEAEEVLTRMDEILEAYGMVRVADMYDLVGHTSDNYTDNNYGWTNIRNAEIARVHDGYIIKMPRIIPLK